MKNDFVERLYTNGVAVVGAGTMGAGIAQAIAQQEIPVFLCDRSLELSLSGKRKIEDSLEEAVQRRIINAREKAACLDRIKTVDQLSAARHAALMIEAVFEDFEVKADLFEQMGRIADSDTIFATNTSSFSVHDLAMRSGRPDFLGGLHFFFHPAKNRLLEVINHGSASKKCEEALWSFARCIRKVSIKTKDSAGFAVNRFFVPWLNEAVRLLEENVADIATIEEAARQAFKIGMGPFELMNVTGIPIARHAAHSLGLAFGGFYEPAHLLVEQAEKGELWTLAGECDSSRFKAVQERLSGCVFLSAAQLVEEGVATMEDTDRGATVGLRWSEGPFQMMNRLGVHLSLAMASEIAARHQLTVPKMLAGQGSAGKPWPLSYIDLSVRDGIARLIFNRPEAMNALNPRVALELKERFEAAENNPEVEAIVFEGVGKAFVAGADIRFFVEAIEGDDLQRIYEFTKEGQDILRRIADSKKMTIALVDGLALGGGAELALACKKIVAGSNARFAFPETGIGIYPGLGGTQRLPRKIGREKARYLICTGQPVASSDAVSIGLADALLSADESKGLDGSERARLCLEKINGPLKKEAEPEWVKVAQLLFSDEIARETIALRKPENVPAHLEAHVDKTLRTLAARAPIALTIADRLIDEGRECPLADALLLELKSLGEIFRTEDAYEGLTSVGKRTPVFKKR